MVKGGLMLEGAQDRQQTDGANSCRGGFTVDVHYTVRSGRSVLTGNVSPQSV
jgi:hypothetical protein